MRVYRMSITPPWAEMVCKPAQVACPSCEAMQRKKVTKNIGNPLPRPAFPGSVKVLVVASDHNRAIQIHLSRIRSHATTARPSFTRRWTQTEILQTRRHQKSNEAQPLLPSPAGSPLPDITKITAIPKPVPTVPPERAVQSLPPGGHPSAHAPGVGLNESPPAVPT